MSFVDAALEETGSVCFDAVDLPANVNTTWMEIVIFFQLIVQP